MFKGKRHVLMEDTPGAAGASGPAAAPAAAASQAPAPAAPAASPAPAPAPAAGGEGAAGSDGSGAPGSALSAGKGAEGDGVDGGAGGAASGVAAIPEKFQVKNDKGEIDPVASAAKVAEAYTKLEKRLGEGGARPKAPADYKLPELPEALKDLNLEGELTDAFREEAHKAGLSQAQFEFVMGKYLDLAPQLVNGGKAVSADETIAELKTAWGKDYAANAGNAWRGLTQVAQIAGLTVQEVESELGNSAAFNRIMAAVGAQMREDTSVNTGGQGAGASSMADAASLQASEAFRNPRHPEHKVTVDKWNAIVTKGVPDTPVM
jgi:hypothetical protein